jgi:hypothetical protein
MDEIISQYSRKRQFADDYQQEQTAPLEMFEGD